MGSYGNYEKKRTSIEMRKAGTGRELEVLGWFPWWGGGKFLS